MLRQSPEIGVGTPQVVDVPLPRSVLMHRYDSPEGSILLVHNLADVAVSIDPSTIDIPKSAHQVFGNVDYEPITKNKTDLELDGWGYCWIRLRRGSRQSTAQAT